MCRVVGPLPFGLLESDANHHHFYRSSEDEGQAGLHFSTGARETTYWDDNGSERWLPWTLVPMRTNRFKKRPHMMQKVCPRQS
ncbi:hypothetical protein E2C01_006043 [Portunus trituberculatus]|uniref:Uncharacterized protein n=1 Tax=Portunus trituberculatus TaxID=210409 RepID=A0A5B7CU80_PORTR|nr:hypothetical protein [Portunus trituberculatus]